MEDMRLCLAKLGESDEDRMISGVLDLLVQAVESGVGRMQPARDDEIDGPGVG
ncbi:hypothetical protein [Thioclava sp. F42-5]|uniref:hypothetical protein n=1 Tax=Thioclava sp. F42-5 TaxID=1973005 RepID=UPI00143DC5E9|nr:hypothetical protein [Thioclava sp. F42-5]